MYTVERGNEGVLEGSGRTDPSLPPLEGM
jgi:hypothetical protein